MTTLCTCAYLEKQQRPQTGVIVLGVIFPFPVTKSVTDFLIVTPVVVPCLQKRLTGAEIHRHTMTIVGHTMVYQESFCNDCDSVKMNSWPHAGRKCFNVPLRQNWIVSGT